MAALVATLKNKLRNAGRIALLGIGSQLRGDDVAGVLVAECLRQSRRQQRLKVFIGTTAPENLTGEIKRFQPTHLIMVDSAEMGKKAGAIAFITPEEATAISFSTHQLPLKIMIDYLAESIGCQVILIGIQPKRLDFGSAPSREVERAAGRIAQAIETAIRMVSLLRRE